MDNDDTQSTCADCITTDLTVELPSVEATVCAVNKEKTTKKARRKANKDQADVVWKVCVCLSASITATTTRATWSNAISAKRGFIRNVSARTTATSSEFEHVRPAVHCQSCGRYYEHSLSILSAINFTKWLRRCCASIMSITKCY